MGSVLTYLCNIFVIYLLRLSVVQEDRYLDVGMERNGWTLGIPCILETVRVSYGTTWEMRVCKANGKTTFDYLAEFLCLQDCVRGTFFHFRC